MLFRRAGLSLAKKILIKLAKGKQSRLLCRAVSEEKVLITLTRGATVLKLFLTVTIG